MKTLDDVLQFLDDAGVRHGSRNKTVAEKTGYSEGTVNQILSGNAKLTARFIKALESSFASPCIGLNDLIAYLDSVGVPKYGRNIAVAEKTGYAVGMVAKILSGHAAVTSRFVSAVYSAFDRQPQQNSVTLNGTYSKDDLIRILYGLAFN